MDRKDFRSVLSGLEAKLFQIRTSDVKLNDSVTRNDGQLTHNNSYLFGSWLSDSVSQGMCLVSLDQDSKFTSQGLTLTGQNDLIDSVYWKWETTQHIPTFDEDIIQDIVNYLEESKNDFWTTQNDPIVSENSTDNHDSIHEETYSDSFMEQFCKPTQLQCTVQRTAGTPSMVHITPSPNDGYSPDLFASLATPKDISTPSRLPTPSRVILFNESLNSPNQLSNLLSRTPAGSTSTKDFTSPAIC